jgi:hypothetical protein
LSASAAAADDGAAAEASAHAAQAAEASLHAATLLCRDIERRFCKYQIFVILDVPLILARWDILLSW